MTSFDDMMQELQSRVPAPQAFDLLIKQVAEDFGVSPELVSSCLSATSNYAHNFVRVGVKNFPLLNGPSVMDSQMCMFLLLTSAVSRRVVEQQYPHVDFQRLETLIWAVTQPDDG